ncbi:MAG: Maf family protein [Bacteroidota bacterium]|nr:Maf family protein [Bacteroidota bacterium]
MGNKTLISFFYLDLFWGDFQVLGKPKNHKEAKEMLTLLSGKKHEVYTGITLRTIDKVNSFFSKTEVWFNELSYSEIEYYINKCKPFDKAGAYAIQEWIGHIAVKKIEGSYSNVVGLPTEKLYSELRKFID